MFNPTLNTRLMIGEEEYGFTPHPVVPSIVWGQEGRHAIVYQIRSETARYALKVFRPVFRHEGLVDAAENLAYYQELPGMRVCRQTVLTREEYGPLIDRHEDLNYAMMMPWIDGQTWFDFLQKKENVTLDQSRQLAENIAWVLYALELNRLAHCDLSSGNVIISPQLKQVDLIDVEDLYSPWIDTPPYVSLGTMGYAHRSVRQDGQWGPLGDRFAGAILLAEMLAWANPEVRDAAFGESYFEPEEVQADSARYRLLRDTLRVYDPGFAETFESAWRSRALEECPPLKTWYDLLDGLPREPVALWAPIDPKKYAVLTERPSNVAVPPEQKPVAPPPRGEAVKKALDRVGFNSNGFVILGVLGLLMTLLCMFAMINAFMMN